MGYLVTHSGAAWLGNQNAGTISGRIQFRDAAEFDAMVGRLERESWAFSPHKRDFSIDVYVGCQNVHNPDEIAKSLNFISIQLSKPEAVAAG